MYKLTMKAILAHYPDLVDTAFTITKEERRSKHGDDVIVVYRVAFADNTYFAFDKLESLLDFLQSNYNI